MTNWRLLAACRDADPALFFGEGDPGRQPDYYSAAKAICAGCGVRGACLEAGLSERFGLWGGLTLAERREIVRRRECRRQRGVA